MEPRRVQRMAPPRRRRVAFPQPCAFESDNLRIRRVPLPYHALRQKVCGTRRRACNQDQEYLLFNPSRVDSAFEFGNHLDLADSIYVRTFCATGLTSIVRGLH
uniref:Uncharacterized protein n=1 Tax=Pleurozia purpurea TaxID=280637 RepID=D0R017_9MARC|nr:hypothetical protein PlpuMp17 [Pleurozia purpurea]ACR19354.1 hypothetical protein PlpuMp17 [Pleurozia purpurea]